MSSVILCDRCGGRVSSTPRYNLNLSHYTLKGSNIDLCNPCWWQFERFLNQESTGK